MMLSLVNFRSSKGGGLLRLVYMHVVEDNGKDSSDEINEATSVASS